MGGFVVIADTLNVNIILYLTSERIIFITSCNSTNKKFFLKGMDAKMHLFNSLKRLITELRF